MKRTKPFLAILITFVILTFIMSVSVVTAFATGDDGSVALNQDGVQADFDNPDENINSDNDNTDNGDNAGYVTDVEPEPGFDDANDTYDDDYYEVPIETAPPEKVDELPQISSEEVQLATTVPIPDIEVSDTSLMGGVIAWMCVALGIAVIAGVLASQRTRQKNPSNINSRR